ncbi:MAG: helix-turn-helix transcriptional regulator [Labilithrix sp.]|nr:helix-turn-helix transcriptional regulator [Labilithrix sp.]
MSRIADPKAKITLLRAAEDVFAERGLAGAKVEEIVRRAGVSKGAFYLHFESKEAALKQLVESFLARCRAFFAPPSDYPDMPDDLGGLLDFAFERDLQIYEFLWQNRAFLRIIPSCHGELDYLVHAFRADITQTTREWFEWGKREGIYHREIDSDLATALVYGAYNELSVRLLTADRRPPLEEWLIFAQDCFFRAFGTPETLAMLEERNQRVSLDIRRPRRPRVESTIERTRET